MHSVNTDWIGRRVQGARSKAISIASSHLILSCATMAAILMFVALGSHIVPAAVAGTPLPSSQGSLRLAFLLNIAIILFGWRRSKDLREALAAYEAAEQVAQSNANTDPTTGLANRRELMRSLGETLAAKRSGALLLLDLDHFKRVNDLHGHLAGDQLLRCLADAMCAAAPPPSCCARMGGDEFAVLLPGSTTAQAEEAAEAILARLAEPVSVEGAQVQMSVSIGIAQVGRTKSEETVLRQGDVALYAAKRSGRSCFAWFDQQLEHELTERLKIEEDIRLGIRNGEFIPFFQPLIDLESREVVGFEVLARWRSPTRGLLEAETFIEAAERTGLVGPLTFTVMEQALSEARSWPAKLKLAVNISPVQFRDVTLAEQILKLLSATGFPASRLELEITEALLLEDRGQVLTIIESLKNVGVSISLDDFGTGYASLAQVNSLPLDRIKIDKSFITTIVKSEKTAAIVSTIAGLGHNLNVPISAEGVESEQIRSALAKFGCSEAQGWLFGRAVSAETVRSFLDLTGDGDGRQKEQDDRTAGSPPRLRRSL
jgi:diguanylate cyclase (GGDEF)-like protein